MKKIFLSSFLLLLPLTAAAQYAWNPWNPGITAANTSAFAPANQPFCNASGCTYIPLEPLPNSQFNQAGYNSLASYLNAVFVTLLSLAALFAVTMLTVSGIRFMLSESVTDKSQAVKRIQASLWGLLLLATSWLILNTINPELLNFKISNVPAQGGTTAVPASTNSGGTQTGPGGTTFVNGNDGASFGTATGDQMRAIAEALGSSAPLDDKYLLVDPTKIDDQAQNIINNFKDNCENSGFFSTVSSGFLHYTMKEVPGSVLGAPDKTAYVCGI